MRACKSDVVGVLVKNNNIILKLPLRPRRAKKFKSYGAWHLFVLYLIYPFPAVISEKIRIYINKRFGSNGMSLGSFGKITIGWSVITFSGIIGFILSKNSVDNRRFDSMQVRERMRKANFGEY